MKHFYYLTALCVAMAAIFADVARAANDYNASYGGPTASDQISGVYIPKMKLQFGINGSAIDVSSSNPLPVQATVSAGTPVGHTPIATFRNLYTVTPVTSGAYLTVISSVAQAVNQVLVYDTSGKTIVLSYAASCGALSASSKSILIAPGGSGSADLNIPSGSCIGIEASSTTASTGEIGLSFLN